MPGLHCDTLLHSALFFCHHRHEKRDQFLRHRPQSPQCCRMYSHHRWSKAKSSRSLPWRSEPHFHFCKNQDQAFASFLFTEMITYTTSLLLSLHFTDNKDNQVANEPCMTTCSKHQILIFTFKIKFCSRKS